MKIREFQNLIGQIYGPANAKRTWDYLFGYLSRTTGYLGKAAKKHAVEPIEIFRPVSWVAALATYKSIDLQDAFFGRYPGICPYCLDAPCICRRTGKKPKSHIASYKLTDRLRRQHETLINTERNSPREGSTLLTLQHAVEIIRSVYPANEIVWFHSGPAYHFGKVHEEVAEIHEAISLLDGGDGALSAVGDELADVLAWLLSAWDICFPEISLEDELYGYYVKGCPVCKTQPCACADRSGRPEGLITPPTLRAMLEIVEKLNSIFASDKLSEVQRSLSSALESHSQPEARLSIADAVEVAKELDKETAPPSQVQEAKGLLRNLAALLKLATPFNDLDEM